MSNSSTAEPEHDFRATLLRRASRMPNGRQKQPRSSLTDDFMRSSNTTSKIGAVFYIIWACLHLLATYSVYVLGRSLYSSMVQGRVFQDCMEPPVLLDRLRDVESIEIHHLVPG